MNESRYSRLERYAGFAETLRRWQNAACAVVGLGGLGGGLAQHLARLGVARLVLIDRDVVNYENLGHQALFTEEHATAGLPKAHAAVDSLVEVNRAVQFVPVVEELNPRTIADLLADVELIFDGLDNYYTRLLVNDWALSSGTPYFYAGVVRGELSARAVIPGITGCLRCLLDRPPAPGEVPTCAAEGVFPPLLGVANALQLDAANRYLAGAYGRDDDVLYSLTVADWRLRQTRLDGPRDDCPACGSRYEYLDGTLDILARQTCGAKRVEMSFGYPVDLAALEKALDSMSGHIMRRNRYCLIAEDGELAYTLFPDGRVILNGSDDPQVLNHFVAKNFGV